MTTSNFSQSDLEGNNRAFEDAVENLRMTYGFDFVATGLTPFQGAPLKWVYGAGATNERYRRIVLSPGHGIGGIVIKSGKPMMFLDIDRQIDPREYSSYPIVFAEDLRSFCALPLLKENRVVGALLCAFRSNSPSHEQRYQQMIDDLQGAFMGLTVIAKDFFNPDSIFEADNLPELTSNHPRSSLSQAIMAQENERRRISRELHDGIAQELLSISFLVRQLQAARSPDDSEQLFAEVNAKIDTIMTELHNLSVELRPSTLDHLGLVPALKSQAVVFEKSYGAEIEFIDKLSIDRFDLSLETQIYRICQEAILNACKYSGADKVLVELEDADDWLCATITDQGQGFDLAEPEIKGSGCGLTGIRERANLIGATLIIESGGEGTIISLVAPLKLGERE